MVAIVPGSCDSRGVVERSAAWMARAVRARQVSAVELFEAHAARIAERDPQVGVQLIGRRGSERTLLALAAELEVQLGGWLRP